MTLAQSLIVFFIIPALNIILWLIIARIIMSWLVAFNVINLNNPMMRQIYNMLDAITEPIMAPFRRLIPPIGGLDLSPILIFFLIQWLIGFVAPQALNMLG